jgi:hypothetical protein
MKNEPTDEIEPGEVRLCPICGGWGTLPDLGGDANHGETTYCSCDLGRDMKETA